MTYTDKDIEIVAEFCGCSPGTVRLVLDNYLPGYTQRIQAEERARVLKAEAEWLEESHRNSADKGFSGELRRGYELAASWVRSHADRAAALAAPVEPTRCTTPGCPGDYRYSSPGRGHIPGCQFPAPPVEQPPTQEKRA